MEQFFESQSKSAANSHPFVSGTYRILLYPIQTSPPWPPTSFIHISDINCNQVEIRVGVTLDVGKKPQIISETKPLVMLMAAFKLLSGKVYGWE